MAEERMDVQFGQCNHDLVKNADNNLCCTKCQLNVNAWSDDDYYRVGGKIMKVYCNLVGLSRPKSMTCEPLDNENVFWPNVAISQERFEALWDYCNGHFDEKKIVEIECLGLYDDGVPYQPYVVGVREAQAFGF